MPIVYFKCTQSTGQFFYLQFWVENFRFIITNDFFPFKHNLTCAQGKEQKLIYTYVVF